MQPAWQFGLCSPCLTALRANERTHGRSAGHTYRIASACCKQVRVQGADCDAVDGDPGFDHSGLFLPLVRCRPKHLSRICYCSFDMPPVLEQGQDMGQEHSTHYRSAALCLLTHEGHAPAPLSEVHLPHCAILPRRSEHRCTMMTHCQHKQHTWQTSSHLSVCPTAEQSRHAEPCLQESNLTNSLPVRMICWRQSAQLFAFEQCHQYDQVSYMGPGRLCSSPCPCDS